MRALGRDKKAITGVGSVCKFLQYISKNTEAEIQPMLKILSSLS